MIKAEENAMSGYDPCHLCPRACGVSRGAGETGYCRMPATPHVARADLHMWEEPCLSGTRGSGTVFFAGCTLRCIYCQNREISRGIAGRPYTVEQLADAYLILEHKGAHNIDLVTATHFLPSVRASVKLARQRGLTLPVVWNTSGYESPSSLEEIGAFTDVYLTDLRYARADTAAAYSFAPDYPEVAVRALEQMVTQKGSPLLDSEGILRRGVVVRLLLLPGHLIEAKQILRRVWTTFGSSVILSLMSQYTPTEGLPAPLDRPVSGSEYRSFVDYAASLGVENAYVQDPSSSDLSYVPPFQK